MRAELDREWSQAADAAAVVRIAAGDAAALREVYDRYAGVVHAAAMRVLRDPGAAEECTQDVFVSVWRHAATFDPDRARFSTWLFAIARNRALELARRRTARPLELHADAPEPTADEATPDASSAVERRDVSERVAEAIASLPDDQASVIRLAYFDGLSHGEIATRLGVPLGTVKGRMRLALEKLRPLAESLVVGAER